MPVPRAPIDRATPIGYNQASELIATTITPESGTVEDVGVNVIIVAPVDAKAPEPPPIPPDVKPEMRPFFEAIRKAAKDKAQKMVEEGPQALGMNFPTEDINRVLLEFDAFVASPGVRVPGVPASHALFVPIGEGPDEGKDHDGTPVKTLGLERSGIGLKQGTTVYIDTDPEALAELRLELKEPA